LREALAALGEEDSPLRVRLLGCLAKSARSPSVTGRAHVESFADQAVTIAQRLGDPATLAHALRALHFSLQPSGDLSTRLATASDIVRQAERAGHREMVMEGLRARIVDLFALGDVR